MVLVITINTLLPILTTIGLALIGSKFAPLELGRQCYIWPIAFLIYEFWYWAHHFLAHKVRLLWCVHSPHHAPDTINMVVG